METIQLVLDAKLLKAADLAAKRLKVNRSALIRQVQEYLKRLHVQDLEARDRRGYEAQPQQADEFRLWDDAAAWPELQAFER
jgi:metal-responsive CopG/Arc/MetJ family transcriptional regulator